MDRLIDNKLERFVSEYYLGASSSEFLGACFNKKRTRQMLYLLSWYIELADGMSVVRKQRPALQVIFLMAAAEGLMTLCFGRRRAANFAKEELVLEFFKAISKDDKVKLERGIQRSLSEDNFHTLRFTTRIKMLYDARSAAVHGEDYWSLSLVNEERRNKEFVEYGECSYGVLTPGRTRGRKRSSGRPHRYYRTYLEIKLTYRDLRSIFARTGLSVIKRVLGIK